MSFVQGGDNTVFALGGIRLIGDGFRESEITACGLWSESYSSRDLSRKE